MFGVLDTNHYVALIAGGPLSVRLVQNAENREADLFTTIITVQEISQGWMAAINKEQAGHDQVKGYSRFRHNLHAFCKIVVLAFDQEAAAIFHQLKAAYPRIGSMDLKIASICLMHDATLLTRNLRDFEPIVGLEVANWLDHSLDSEG